MNELSVLDVAQKRFKLSLDVHLNPYLPCAKIGQAVCYSMALGKRLRPALIYSLGDAFHLSQKWVDLLAMCVESIHCYSLIHDDLPIMDDSDQRRGQAACHKRFDEVNALLAGSWLQNHAFFLATQLPNQYQSKVNQLMVAALGNQGIITGQAMEFDYLSSDHSDVRHLYRIVEYKTIALFKLSFMLMLCLDSKLFQYQPIFKNIASAFGMAFQMKDDLDDLKEDALKKEHYKKNIAIALGVKKTNEMIQDYQKQIDFCLKELPFDMSSLSQVINLCIV